MLKRLGDRRRPINIWWTRPLRRNVPEDLLRAVEGALCACMEVACASVAPGSVIIFIIVRTVRSRQSLGRAQLALLAACAPLFAAAVGAATWAITQQLTASLSVTGLALTFAIAVGGRFFDHLIAQRRTGPVAPGLAATQREEWSVWLRAAVLRRRVRDEDSSLRQMVRHGPAVDPRARDRVDASLDDAGRPRLRIHGHTVPLSEITRQWDESPSRIVILGEPGYGKTVAALMLLSHVNSHANTSGHPLAELFPLAEWYRWHVEHPDGGLGDWLADQLVVSYPDLPWVAAQSLVDCGLVVPILDGLDEVPNGERAACRDAIDSYAGPSEPFRPFVLTCRAREYAELETDWVPADRQFILIGLEPDQIAEVLAARTTRWTGWAAVRDRINNGDFHLCELFRSPLRLGITLQVYRGRDPWRLVRLDLDAAKDHLWNALLELGGPGFGGASLSDVRRWLRFLAVEMHRTGRQRFWLHELYLFAPSRTRYVQEFKDLVGLTCAVPVGMLAFVSVTAVFPGSIGLFLGLLFGLMAGLVVRMGGKLAGGLAGGVLFMLFMRLSGLGIIYGPLYGAAAGLIAGFDTSVTPLVRTFVPWRIRLLAVRRHSRRTLSLVPGVMLAFGVAWSGDGITGVIAGLLFGMGIGLLLAMSIVPMDLVNAGRVSLMSDPPRRLAGRKLSGVLDATRNCGLVAALIAGLAVGLGAGLFAWWGVHVVRHFFPKTLLGAVDWLVAGLAGGLIAGLIAGLVGGLDAWVYHHWLRRQLANRQLLPRELCAFLEWCAAPPRYWLRVSDACEFRHRELLDYLASERGRSLHARTTGDHRQGGTIP